MDRRKIDYIIELSLFGNPENLRISKLMLALNFVKRDLENVSVDIYIYASIHLKQYNWTVASLVYKTRRLYFRSPWRRHAGRGGSRASLSVRTEQVLPLHLEFCRGYTLTYISLSLTSPLGRHEPSLCRLHPRPVDVRLGKVSSVISQCWVLTVTLRAAKSDEVHFVEDTPVLARQGKQSLLNCLMGCTRELRVSQEVGRSLNWELSLVSTARQGRTEGTGADLCQQV